MIHSNESTRSRQNSEARWGCFCWFSFSGSVSGGCAPREGGSPMHQSAAFISSFKELFVSITFFFHRHIGCSKASPCYLSSPFLLRRAVDRSGHRERCFCFDDRRASVFFAHAASLPLRPSLWIALTQEGTLCNSCGVLFSTWVL